MKNKKFTENQILGILKEYAAGVSAKELARKHGFYYGTLYEWKKRYGE
ncbi:MAG: transposase, partial [Thermonemataceae bacterium]